MSSRPAERVSGGEGISEDGDPTGGMGGVPGNVLGIALVHA